MCKDILYHDIIPTPTSKSNECSYAVLLSAITNFQASSNSKPHLFLVLTKNRPIIGQSISLKSTTFKWCPLANEPLTEGSAENSKNFGLNGISNNNSN